MATQTSASSAALDWDFIIETIKAEKCVLFLGPGAFRTNEGEKLNEALSKYLEVDNNQDILSFYEKDGFFLFNSSAGKTKTYYKIKKFFSQEFDTVQELLGKIAEVPFHLIVSVTADELLAKTFSQLNFPHQFSYYRKNQKPEEIKNPTKTAPVIYNLFGSVEQEESMVLTHDDLYEYFHSIFGNWNLPDELKEALENAHNLIFLGLDFDKWYMQLLLRMLYLHNQEYKFHRYAANQTVNPEIKSLCIDQFNIEFISGNIGEFVGEVHRRCGEQNILRIAGEQRPSVMEQIVQLVSMDDIEEALLKMKSFVETLADKGEDFIDDITILVSRHRRLIRKTTQGIIDSSEGELELNKIRKDLLEMTNLVKSFE